MLTSQGLPSDSTYVLKAVPGKLDIKRNKPDILFISLPTDSLLKLAIDIIFHFCVDSASLTASFEKYNRYVIMT